MAEVREITRSALIRARSEIRASVMPSAKYSCAGSRDTFSSGSTASERITSRAGSDGAPDFAASRSRRSISPTAPAEAGRDSGCLLWHSASSRSSSAGASGRSERTAGGALLRISNISASGRSLWKGLRPVAISKSRAPRA